MRNVRSLAVLALFALPVAFAPLAARADLVTFGSGVSTVSYTNTFGSGTAVLYDSTTPYGVGSYATPASGTKYITWDDDHTEANVPAGDTTYTVLLDGEAGGTGSVSFAADNSVVVYLNGTEIGSSSTFNSLTTDNFAVLAGTNTLSFVVTNTVANPVGSGNPTALDFGGSLTVAAVPEPSSMALLGTGLLSVAGLARRKFRG